MSIPQQKAWNTTEAEENGLDRLLWWLSTAEYELVHDLKVDRNRYRIIGTVVLCTWLFATLAWTYFFSTVVTSTLVYIAMGLFMGFIILTIDRALIKGINRTNRTQWGALLLRSALALTIGLFMAQPAVLFLFDKEVQLQANVDNEARRQQKREQLTTAFAPRRQALQSEKEGYDKQLKAKYTEVETARQQYLSETDGTAGSGKVGISNIALAKRAEYQKLEQAYTQLQRELQPKAEELALQLKALDDSLQKQETAYAALLNTGFLTRVEALSHLIEANQAVATRYYLIIAILMLIELMPVIAKSMLPSGPYDERVRMTELEERERARRNLDKEDALKEHYNQAALDADKAALDAFFAGIQERRLERMETLAEQWSGNKHQSFDALWNRIKREVLSRQEG